MEINGEHDVFLSFCRQDVGYSFVDLLYEFMAEAGIRVFRDDKEICFNELRRGQAIYNSKVWVVVFSRNYADSAWCLWELATILDHPSVSTDREMVLPIFYDVSPLDVRLYSNVYRKALNKHKPVYGLLRVQKWEEALVEAASIMGWIFRDFAGGERKFVKQIAHAILGKLRNISESLPESLARVQNQEDEVMKLVGHDSPEVRFVLVHGMGGIGKTTLAKVVFNKMSRKFDGSCFISNVRESSKVKGGIAQLQKRLLCNILGFDTPVHDSCGGIAGVGQRLRAKKVLIVLDDVDDISQIWRLAGNHDWFGLGTRIIITTRFGSIAEELMAFQDVSDFEMKEMSDEHSLQLFSRHAFRGDKPPPDYHDLSRELVQFTGNIPLTLAVVGKHLHGRSIPVWEETLEKLKLIFPLRLIFLQRDTGKAKLSTLDERSHEDTLYEIQTAEEKSTTSLLESKNVEGEAKKEQAGIKGSAKERFPNLKVTREGTQLAARDHTIAIDRQVECLIDFVDRGSHGVWIIGIRDKTKTGKMCGPWGIGSTTLAKAVYSRVSSQFDACCFLEEITEAVTRPDGIRQLQFKLIHDILGVEYDDDTSYEEAFDVLKEVLRHMKVLIVLDDLENISRIKEFIGDELKSCLGPGSTIIVTIRGKDAAAEHLGEDLVLYESVRLMKADVAVELFSRHAFGKDYSVAERSAFVETIVSKLQGCPLLIEVVGSLLRGKEAEEFETMSVLIGPPTRNFWDILTVLYGALDEAQKQIFLDIACFAANEDVQTAKYMWHECLSRYPGRVLMPFAKVGKGDRLWLHSSVKRFGREIVRAEDKENSGISSRIFVHQTAVDIINNGRGTEEVEAICLHFGGQPSSMEITAANFGNMLKLRFLNLDSAALTGNFNGVFPKLRWLQWRRCPKTFEATNVDMKDLVILDLSGSAVTGDWKGWVNINLVNLKVINLSNCADLLFTPKFKRFPNLERLILEGCPRLVCIDPSVGALKHLVFLNLRFCQELNRLPAELGKLVSLRELLIDGTGVEEIPDIAELRDLEILSCLDCISLRCIPDSVVELGRLRKLSVRDCRRVEHLPESIGNLHCSLVELDISGTGVAELPGSISQLLCLKVLRMDGCFISQIPGSIGCLSNLEELCASCCRNLKEIPPGIGKLKELRILELRYAGISALPKEVSKLEKLEKLDILHCDKLKQPPSLPPSLKVVLMNPQLKRQIKQTSTTNLLWKKN